MPLRVFTKRIPLLPVERVLDAPDAVMVDLRSPSEFAQDHLPGAHNVPLFDDVERAIVGTLYKRSSRDDAFEAGRQAAADRIESLVAEIASIAKWAPPEEDLRARLLEVTAWGIDALENDLEMRADADVPVHPVVLYCWRGGLRSRSVASFLRALGLRNAIVMEGGYKGYRRHVMTEIAAWRAPACYALRGLTGVGKTLVLRELERQRPGWTFDLEEMAGHRSSILGMVGLEPCSQRTFESRIYSRMRAGFAGPCVFEGESRKVGDAIQPAPVWNALAGATRIRLDAPVDVRVRVLVDDYLADEANRAPLREQLPFIEQRLGPVRWKGKLVELLDQRREEELVEILLEQYYDPLYRHSEGGYEYELSVDSSDPIRAASEIAAWIESGG